MFIQGITLSIYCNSNFLVDIFSIFRCAYCLSSVYILYCILPYIYRRDTGLPDISQLFFYYFSFKDGEANAAIVMIKHTMLPVYLHSRVRTNNDCFFFVSFSWIILLEGQFEQAVWP